MTNQIKAKVSVREVIETTNGPDGPKYSETVSMALVYGTGEENKSYSDATPSGSISLTITNKDTWSFFVDGKEYYVDFTPAD